MLDKKFPEWRFPILGPQIKGCNASSALLVRGDFDGDGLPDYAVQIVYRGDLLVVALLGNGRKQVLAIRSRPTAHPWIRRSMFYGKAGASATGRCTLMTQSSRSIARDRQR